MKVVFVEASGRRTECDGKPGASLMETAVRNGVSSILAECGGACACATCHVHIEPGWTEVVGPPSRMEAETLEFAEHVGPASRLACQIRLSEALDGLTVNVPPSPY